MLHRLEMAAVQLLGLDLGQQIQSHETQRFLKMADVDNENTSIDQASFPKGLAPPPPCAMVAMLLLPGGARLPSLFFVELTGAVKSVLTPADPAGALLNSDAGKRVKSFLSCNSYLQLSPDCRAHWHLLYMCHAGDTVAPDLDMQVALADW